MFEISIFYIDGEKTTFSDVIKYIKEGDILTINLLLNNPETLFVNLNSVYSSGFSVLSSVSSGGIAYYAIR